MAEKPLGARWLEAVNSKDLEVTSARDALQISGWLDSGSYALNWAMSGRFLRGYPLGATVEIFGDPSTGKSFLVTRALAQAQAQGGVALLDDTEGAYNLEWIGTLGVNADALAYRRSRTVNDHLKTTRQFVGAVRDLIRGKGSDIFQGPAVLACDSLSLLTTEHELEVGLDKRSLDKARELKAFFRIVGGEIVDLPVTHIATSHAIAKIGGFGSSRTTSGGGGPKYQAGIRLDLRAVSKIKKGTQYSGVIVRVVVAKNRVVAPWKEARLAIPFYRPISPLSGLIPTAIDAGVLKPSGQNGLTFQGSDIKAQHFKTKSLFLKQDQEAEKLLVEIPDFLEQADEMLADRYDPQTDDPQDLENAEESETLGSIED